MAGYFLAETGDPPDPTEPERGRPLLDITQNPIPLVGIAVVDADEAIRTRLAMQLGDTVVPVSSVAALSERLTGQPIVAVLGPSCARDDDLETVEAMIAAHPEVGAILITTELSTELFRRA